MTTNNSTASKAQASKAQDVPQTGQEEAQDIAPTVEAEEAQTGALDTAAVAALAGVTPKDFRRWLRASVRAAGAGDTLPGKGRRYGYTQAQAEALALAYRQGRKAQGTQAPAAAALAFLTTVAPVEAQAKP